MSLLSKFKRVTPGADRQQCEAADPAVSAWVSANAGTGKTYILTNRVLRLLLANTDPERILALTYTKAAAAEMSKRVFDRLSRWVVASEQDLVDELTTLLGRRPSFVDLQRARQLFAVAMETPGGLKVQTIHAFCERLLQRFPLEAGVPTNFAILDDQERRVLLAEAIDEMLAEASNDRQDPLWSALQTVVTYTLDDAFEQILPQVFLHCGPTDLAPSRLPDMAARLRRACGVRTGATCDSLTAELIAVFSEDMMPMLAAVLREGTQRDLEQAAALQAAMSATSPGRRAEALEWFFLTQRKEPRASLMTKRLGNAWPDLAARLQVAQQQFVERHAELKALVAIEATVALAALAGSVLERYTAAKTRRAALDFEDLIGKAVALLSVSDAVDWVLYKLDGGLEHILVDEAQDTSSSQWAVIAAIAAEFFSGEGAHQKYRTLFAVGDEKQSIYGFQGAAPGMFAQVGKAFAARAARGKLAWRTVPLEVSFRSTKPLLRAVDEVFAQASRTPGVTSADKKIQHIARRTGQSGLFEIWPTEKPEAVDAPQPWSPLQEKPRSSPVARLAARIADKIQGWLNSAEILQSENRPIRPGDILILVRKRLPFAPAMVSALKARGIAVAGADRMILIDHIAVQDFMALGEFITLPDDDLALASVLKSPLFGLGDDDLLHLGARRSNSLWERVLEHAKSDRGWAEVARTLERWRRQANLVPPYEFFSTLLDGEGMRARILARLGNEALESLGEFLSLALDYDATASPSLQGFLGMLRDGRHEIKRDMEQGRDEVRVMTVHGAKGLEAPIVFLPDTCSNRSGRQPASLLKLAVEPPLDSGSQAFLWPVKGASCSKAVERAKADADALEAEERDRLLYVALTRARDRLYVAGFESKGAPPQDCWYNLIKAALQGDLSQLSTPDGLTVWRLESAQTAPREARRESQPAVLANASLPPWAAQPARADLRLPVVLTPSRLAAVENIPFEDRGGPSRRPLLEPSALSPIAPDQQNRYLRGNLIHALLERLPELPCERWSAAADLIAGNQSAALPADVRKHAVAETLAILGDPRFASLFGPQSRAEVPIVAEIASPHGAGSALRLAGKIDRLLKEENSILIIDYKTNRPPPADPELVPDAYLLQLAAYRLAIGQIFKACNIRAAILWTDGPRIMEISRAVLDSCQQRLWDLSKARLDA